MAITRIRGLQQVVSGSITPVEISSSIAGEGIVFGSSSAYVSGSGISLDAGHAPTFTHLTLTDSNETSVAGFITVTGSTQRADADGTNHQFGIIVENDISASTVHSDFLIVSESVNVGSGSSIWGGDSNDTHEFTGSLDLKDNLHVDGDVTVDGNVKAQSFIVKSTVTEQTILAQSGSTAFGDTTDDTHQFTGSVDITGSLAIQNGWDQSDTAIPDAESVTVLNIPTGSITIGTGSLTVTDITVGSDSLNAQGTVSASKFHAGTSGVGAVGLDVEGDAVIGQDLTVLGSTYISGTIKLEGGDLQLGDGGGDNIILTGEISSSIIPDAHHTYDLGSTTQAWDDLFVRKVSGSDGTFTELSIDKADGLSDKVLVDTAHITSPASTRVHYTDSDGNISGYDAKTHLAGLFSGSFSGSFEGTVPAESVTGLNLSQIADLDGDAVVKTERTADEDKIIMAAPSNVSVTGSIYASGSDGASINIGKAEGADYSTNGLYTDLTEATSVGVAIDRFNTVLKSLAPAQVPQLMNTADKRRVLAAESTTVSFTDGVADYSSTGLSGISNFGTDFYVGFTDSTTGSSGAAYKGIATTSGASSDIALGSVYTAISNTNNGTSGGSALIRGFTYPNSAGDDETIILHINSFQLGNDGTYTNYNQGAFDQTGLQAGSKLEVEMNDDIQLAVDLLTHGDGAIDTGTSGTATGITRPGTITSGIQLKASALKNGKFVGTGDEFTSFKHRDSLVIKVTGDSQRRGINWLRVKSTINGQSYTSDKIEWVNFKGDVDNVELTLTDNGNWSAGAQTLSSAEVNRSNNGTSGQDASNGLADTSGKVSGIQYGHRCAFSFDSDNGGPDATSIANYYKYLWTTDASNGDLEYKGSGVNTSTSNVGITSITDDATVVNFPDKTVYSTVPNGTTNGTSGTSAKLVTVSNLYVKCSDDMGFKQASGTSGNYTPGTNKLLVMDQSPKVNTQLEHFFQTEHYRLKGSSFKSINSSGTTTAQNLWDHYDAISCGDWDSAQSVDSYDDGAGMAYIGGRAWHPKDANIGGITKTDFSTSPLQEWPTQGSRDYSSVTGEKSVVFLFKQEDGISVTGTDLYLDVRDSGGNNITATSDWKPYGTSLTDDQFIVEMVHAGKPANGGAGTAFLDCGSVLATELQTIDGDPCRLVGNALESSDANGSTANPLKITTSGGHSFLQDSYIAIRITVSSDFSGQIRYCKLSNFRAV